MPSSFVHLHNHTEYSMLDGLAQHTPLFTEVDRLGQPAVAATDHGNMFGAYDFWKASQKFNAKPIIGIEAYLAPSTRFSRKQEFWGQARMQNGGTDAAVEGGKDVAGGGRYTHMTMLARNAQGLRNLFRLSSLASYEGHYMKPRMDRELISHYSEGVIATTGCPSGEVQTRLRLGQYDQALAAAAAYQDIFGRENFYCELMDHGLDIERGVRNGLLEIAKALDLPLLATNDSHYVTRDQADSHDNLLCVGVGRNKNDPNRFKFDGSGYYIKSAEEMRHLWRDYLTACDNTLLIAEMVESYDDVFKHVYRMPSFPVPEGETQESWFRKEVQRGLHARYPDGIPEDRQKQAEYEMDIIVGKGYASYFLVVADFINWAKNNGILVGPGRGCLTGDVPVLTERGTVPLREVRVGDVVTTHTGAKRPVYDTHRYECDETLLHLRTYYDDQIGVTLTGDHKVWAEKTGHEGNARRRAQGYRWAEPTGEMGWVRADELVVGDLLAMPRPQGPWVDIPSIDLARYADDRCEVTESEIIERHSVNMPFKYSVRDVHRVTGVTRNALRAMLSPDRKSLRSTMNKVMEYVGERFSSLDDWAEYVVENQTRTVRVPRYVRVDDDFCFLMGALLSNGWLRRKDPAEVGLAVRRSHDDGHALDLLSQVWGASPSVHNHPSTDLRQYRIQSRVARAFYLDQWSGYDFKAQSKTVPAWMLNLPEEKRRALLDGLWWGDGCHSGKSTFSTTSVSLRDAVRHLLLSLGLPAGVRHEERADDREGWPSKALSWTITTTPGFEEMRRQHGWSDETYVYLRLRSIDQRPAEPVYDISVEEDHSYTTSSFAVHNSGAGSICAYAMRITDLDPLTYGLIFERFLNPERPSMPDFDIDFDDRQRARVIAYVTQKYGAEYTAMVNTFGRMKAKQALKDSARILDMPFVMGDRLSKAHPPDQQGRSMPIKEVFNPEHKRYAEGADMRALYENDVDAKRIIDTAMGMEGVVRQTGVHAAAVILSSEPLLDVIPMHRRDKDGVLITGFDYPSCEDMGLVKMDFLGLKNLTTVGDAIVHVRNNRGVEVVLDELTRDPSDPAVYRLLARGETLGVFQLDGGGMRALLRLMQPDQFEDISATLALYRPGPMGVNAHTSFALRKNGVERVVPIHPELEAPLADILSETYGLIVYQEQVQQVAQKVAGYTLGKADMLRRAMGKKKPEVLAAEYIPFERGMLKNGYSREAVKALWDVLVPFSDYAFNKAHTAAYGMVSYWTAYLKAHYPTEFMASLLTTEHDDKDKLAVVLLECKRMKIKVLSPDVNDSEEVFTPVGDDIRFGLAAIRNVGEGVVATIKAVREESGPFVSFEDFVRRVPAHACNKKVLESLIKAGAFDSLGQPRMGLLVAMERVLDAATPDKKAAEVGQESLFDEPAPEVEIANIEWDKRTLLAFEREMLGLYVSDHPLNGLENLLTQYAENTVVDIIGDDEARDRQEVTIAGLVTSVQRRHTKDGKPWAILTVEDLTGSIQALVFPRSYEKLSDLLAVDSVCWVGGNIMVKEDGAREVAVGDLRPLDDLVATVV